MNNAKRKSPGWRPLEKRRTWEEQKARHNASGAATARTDCNGLGRWRRCPVRRCRRAQSCTGDPWLCREQRRPKVAGKPDTNARATTEAANSAARAAGNEQPRFAISAKEAAAAIAASIADDAQQEPADELEAMLRAGRIHDEPRR
jgi:hypothetical protein